MKKVLSILFSIVLFLALSFIIYIFIFKIYLNSDTLSTKLKENTIINYTNLDLENNSSLVNNINTTYQDLKLLGLTEKQIKELVEKTKIDTIINNIIIDKLNYIIEGGVATTTYSKQQLDTILTADIPNEEIKTYIINNDYKILNFDSNINNDITNINNKYLSLLRTIASHKTIIIILFILVIDLLGLIYTSSKYFYNYLFTSILIVGINSIIISVLTPGVLNIYFENTIISYMFNNVWLSYFKYTLLISIILSLIAILGLIIDDKTKSQKVTSKKIKPRLRRKKQNEEDFSF